MVMLIVAIQMTSCKSDEKKADKKERVSNAAFVVNKAKNTIEWTAYKFTEKTGVKGKFKKVNVTAGGEGNTVKEAIHNMEFSIPVSSVFTSNTDRDYKIKKFFFGIMEDPELLSGKLTIENDSIGTATITMNGITENLPFQYAINGKEFTMFAKMDVINWNAQSSIDSLNAICKDLHKGLDGKSKLWSEVDLTISSVFQ